jgi:lysozyme family protein
VLSEVTTKEELNMLITRHILDGFDDKTAFGWWYIGNIFSTESLGWYHVNYLRKCLGQTRWVLLKKRKWTRDKCWISLKTKRLYYNMLLLV